MSRGPRGYFGFAKYLRGLDEKGDGQIDIYKLTKGAMDFRLETNEMEVEKAVEFAGARTNNSVNYIKFLEKLAGELNEYREKTVRQFFERQDKEFRGYISNDQIYSKFLSFF